MRKLNLIRLPFLVLALIWIAGCATTKPIPDPLAGWKHADNLGEPNETITKDYQAYIQQLPDDERFHSPVFYFEDGTGQYAIAFQVALNGSNWRHILIYDKNNNRIKVIKYFSGHYRC